MTIYRPIPFARLRKLSSLRALSDTPRKSSQSLGRLEGILSKMKVRDSSIYDTLKTFGNSDSFNYATNKRYIQDELKNPQLNTWNKFLQYDINRGSIKLPLNGFEEMIILTEQGRLWKYPIDNDQGLEKEKETPFEDHVFLDHFLQEFPQNEYIQSFMELIVSGLAKNHWITVSRKHEIIKFYKEYFEDKRDLYKEAGFDM